MELWSSAHAKTLLPALVIMIILSAFLRVMLIDKPKKVRMLPLQIIAVLLLLLEVGKQAVSFSRGYNLYHIPLHFCSLLLLTLPAMAFYTGKYAERVCAIGTAINGAIFWLTAIYPCLIYSSGNIEAFFQDYLDFHTVAFHNLAMLSFLLILFLDLHTPKAKGETKPIVIFITVFCIVAAIASQLLQTNYAGFYSCNVPVIENIRLSLQANIGYTIAQLIYVVALMIVHYGFILGFYALYKSIHKLFSREKSIA